MKDDLSNLARAMKLLQLDYLGATEPGAADASALRRLVIPAEGYDLNLDELKSIFEEVESYELLSVWLEFTTSCGESETGDSLDTAG